MSEVLNRKRALSSNMIRRLHDKLGISANVPFAQPFASARRKAKT